MTESSTPGQVWHYRTPIRHRIRGNSVKASDICTQPVKRPRHMHPTSNMAARVAPTRARVSPTWSSAIVGTEVSALPYPAPALTSCSHLSGLRELGQFGTRLAPPLWTLGLLVRVRHSGLAGSRSFGRIRAVLGALWAQCVWAASVLSMSSWQWFTRSWLLVAPRCTPSLWSGGLHCSLLECGSSWRLAACGSLASFPTVPAHGECREGGWCQCLCWVCLLRS